MMANHSITREAAQGMAAARADQAANRTGAKTPTMGTVIAVPVLDMPVQMGAADSAIAIDAALAHALEEPRRALVGAETNAAPAPALVIDFMFKGETL